MENKDNIAVTLKDLRDLDRLLKDNKEVSNKACNSLKKNGKHIVDKIKNK